MALTVCFAAAAAGCLGIELRGDGLAYLKGREAACVGRVLAVEKYQDDSLTLRVKITEADGKKPRGLDRVLLRIYAGEGGISAAVYTSSAGTAAAADTAGGISAAAELPESLYGKTISFYAVIEEPTGRRNPGCFDYGTYLKSRGVTGVCTAGSIRVRAGSGEDPLTRAARALLIKKRRFIDALPDGSRAIAAGLLFGDTDMLEEEVYDDFRVNGTAHILAVSGLHVSMIYEWSRRLAGKKQSGFSVFATGVLLAAYAFLSSWSVSAVRAASMVMLRCAAVYRDRRYDTLTAAAAVALVMVMHNPYVVFGTGFQMSFLAVLSMEFIGKRLPGRIPRGAAASAAVYAGLVPYQAYVFNTVSLTAPIVNVPVIYLAGMLVPAAFAGFVIFSLFGVMLPAQIYDALSAAITGINGLFAADGNRCVDVCSPGIGLVAGFYLALFFLLSEGAALMWLRGNRRKLAAVLVCVLALSAVTEAAFYDPCGNAQVVFVDVGQGDCTHIRVGKTNIMIDGGGRADYNVGKKTLRPYLLKNGVRKLDLAIATHGHTDHIKGLLELEEAGMADEVKTGCLAGKVFRVAGAAAPRDVLDAAAGAWDAASGAAAPEAAPGSSDADAVYIRTLWPVDLKDDPGQEENGSCSVFMIYYGKVKILVTGDLDSAGEKELIKLYGKSGALKADILKAGHHGSAGSTSDEFLEAVSPRYAVFQVGRNNYGHPDIKVIEKCRKNGIMVLRNDKLGAVGFSLRGNEIEYHTVVKAAAD